MDSTLGNSFTNNSCNESTLSLFNSTPRCMLFSSISESFNIPAAASESPTERSLRAKASTSTPSFANDSYSDILKVRPPRAYASIDQSSPSRVTPSPGAGMKPPSRPASAILQPRKDSPPVLQSLSSILTAARAGAREVPSISSSGRTASSSSSVSSLNSDDDTFFDQLATLQNTIENSLPASHSPSAHNKITDFHSLLTGEILSRDHSSRSNSPLKDPGNQFCVSKARQEGPENPGNPTHPLTETNGQRSDEEKPPARSEGVEGDRGKENTARPPVSAIKPTQIIPQWGGEGSSSSKPAQKRVTFENKPREEQKSLSKSTNPIPTPTRPESRFRKIQSAPVLYQSPTDTDTLSINSKVWCPSACVAPNTSLTLSPSVVPPKRICRGGSTPEFPSSPASKFTRSQSSPADTSLNSSLNPLDDLLGDNSRSHVLPVVKGSNPDLKSIEPETLVRVLTGEFSQHIANLVIVDARYPYEYAGGHIRTALNIWTEELNYQFFLKTPYVSSSDLRHIVVFYCEFSTMRGPSQYRYLRNEDRKMNEDSFPKLHYPELYVLNGGYARFFSVASDKCDPRSYIPMLHEDYKEELAKSQLLKHKGSKRSTSSASGRVARPTKSKCRRKQKFN